jgi:hypothetical protein
MPRFQILKENLSSLPYWRMEPKPELAVGGPCLAIPGQIYAFFVKPGVGGSRGTEITVNLTGLPGSATMQWINTWTGQRSMTRWTARVSINSGVPTPSVTRRDCLLCAATIHKPLCTTSGPRDSAPHEFHGEPRLRFAADSRHRQALHALPAPRSHILRQARRVWLSARCRCRAPGSSISIDKQRQRGAHQNRV